MLKRQVRIFLKILSNYDNESINESINMSDIFKLVLYLSL